MGDVINDMRGAQNVSAPKSEPGAFREAEGVKEPVERVEAPKEIEEGDSSEARGKQVIDDYIKTDAFRDSYVLKSDFVEVGEKMASNLNRQNAVIDICGREDLSADARVDLVKKVCGFGRDHPSAPVSGAAFLLEHGPRIADYCKNSEISVKEEASLTAFYNATKNMTIEEREPIFEMLAQAKRDGRYMREVFATGEKFLDVYGEARTPHAALMAMKKKYDLSHERYQSEIKKNEIARRQHLADVGEVNKDMPLNIDRAGDSRVVGRNAQKTREFNYEGKMFGHFKRGRAVNASD